MLTVNQLVENFPYVGSQYIENIYNYGSDGLLRNMYQGILYFTYAYDNLNRVKSENVLFMEDNNLRNEYTYLNGTT